MRCQRHVAHDCGRSGVTATTATAVDPAVVAGLVEERLRAVLTTAAVAVVTTILILAAADLLRPASEVPPRLIH